jgi:hypothetical protein
MLFLHQSVSRYKPPRAQCEKWVTKWYNGPLLRLPRTECHITLLQPRTARPAQSFVNPHKRLVYSVNDGLGFAVIALLAAGQHPREEYDEASHICGVHRCINPDHLRWEDLGTNAARNMCHYYGVTCTHVPRCIMVTHEERGILTKYLRTK